MSDRQQDKTLGQLVLERPIRARIFEELGLDYCCGGQSTLTQACAERGLNVESVLARIEESDSADHNVSEVDVAGMTITELCDHIEETHHQYLRDALPRITQLIEQVVAAHVQRHPELGEVQRVFSDLRAELDSHMWKEENILFPACRDLERPNAAEPHFGSVANPIRVMVMEHEHAGNALAALRKLTADYTLPPDGCPTYAAMLEEMGKLEVDLHIHIHKENNVLFPRAIEAEAR